MKNIILVAAIAALTACTTDQIVQRQVVDISQQQRTNIESGIRSTLKDPGSAQFQNVRVTRDVHQSGKVLNLVCGQVNARNGFGGYNGFKYFTGELNGDNFTIGVLSTGKSDWIAASVCR